MIPQINLYEIKSDIIQNLTGEFTDLDVRDNTASSENYSTDFKVCRVGLSLGKDRQAVSSVGTLDVILYYYDPSGIEEKMDNIITYLLYEVDSSTGEVTGEKLWETTNWRYKINYRNLYDTYASENNEYILPAALDIRAYGK